MIHMIPSKKFRLLKPPFTISVSFFSGVRELSDVDIFFGEIEIFLEIEGFKKSVFDQ